MSEATLRELALWLVTEGHTGTDAIALLAGLAARLEENGVKVDRITTHLQVIDPHIRSVWRTWWRDRPPEERRPVHGIEQSPFYQASPVRKVWEEATWLDCPIDPTAESQRFPIITDLAAQGFTHYVIGPLTYSNGRHHAMSFATRTPGGFTADQIALLRDILLWVAPVFETKSLRHLVRHLFGSYLGQDTLNEVLSGRVRLGDHRERRAALWYSDMRGFTPLTEGQPMHEVVSVLNGYFGLVGAAATRHRGEIVQFIGDAALLYFAVEEGETDADACHRALSAAVETLAELKQWSDGRVMVGRPGVRIGIGLEIGDIVHVNIGADGRQAYNVVGGAVNRAARIEELTKRLGNGLLISGDVAALLPGDHPCVGNHALRGVGREIAIHEPDPVLVDRLAAAWAETAQA